MKRLFLSLLSLNLFFTTLPAEEDSPWGLATDFTASSLYVWRGILNVNDPVLQPAVALSYEGLSASVWGNVDLTNGPQPHGGTDTQFDFTEIDLSLAYDCTWDCLDFSVGGIRYLFPNTRALATTELFATLTYQSVLLPTLSFYRDVDQVKGWYSSFSLSHLMDGTYEVSCDASMSIELFISAAYANAAYNRSYFGVDKSGFNDLQISAFFPVQYQEQWAFIPGVNFSTLMDNDLANGAPRKTNFWFSLSATYTF